MTPIFDGLPPQSLAELYDILAHREPKILGIIRAGDDLTATERRRVDHAVIAESVSALGPDYEETPEHLHLRELVSATRALVPTRNTEIPGWGTRKKGDPPSGDPYGDGGAANGYGPQPSSPS